VNNAGIFFTKRFTDYTPETSEGLFSTNSTVFIYLSQLVVTQMLTRTRWQRGEHHASLAIPNRWSYGFCAMITKGGIESISKPWRWSM